MGQRIPVGGSSDSYVSVNIPTVGADEHTIANILSVVYTWAGIIAVVVLIIAGFIYVTSNGKPETIERAKNAILGSVVGLVVIMVAFVVTQLVVYLTQS